MWRNLFKQITKFLLIAVLLLPTLLPLEANAQVYEGVRDMSWDKSAGKCVGGGYNETTKKHTADDLDFNPLGVNLDMNFELSNGVCATYMGTIGAGVAAIMISSYFACKPTNPAGLAKLPLETAWDAACTAAGATLPFPNPGWALRLATITTQCSARMSENAFYVGLESNPATAALGISGGALAAADVARCCPVVITTGVLVAAAVAALATIYAVSDVTYKMPEFADMIGNLGISRMTARGSKVVTADLAKKSFKINLRMG